MLTLGLGLGIQKQSGLAGQGGSSPVEEFNIITEDGNDIVTEGGDEIVSEDAP